MTVKRNLVKMGWGGCGNRQDHTHQYQTGSSFWGIMTLFGVNIQTNDIPGNCLSWVNLATSGSRSSSTFSAHHFEPDFEPAGRAFKGTGSHSGQALESCLLCLSRAWSKGVPPALWDSHRICVCFVIFRILLKALNQ